MRITRFLLRSAALLTVLAASPVLATNGMNLEGYGPIATGMGGASMAYDNGTAAIMNNPATLNLMPESDRFDLAIGFLGPHVTAERSGMPEAKSSADAFYMPAFGWVRKSGLFTYGAGIFSQGGMGTEYSADSFLAAGSGEQVRSEVAVGRLLFPLAYQINEKFGVGGSLDFVWASMDLKMALSGGQFFNMAGMDPNPGAVQQQFGSVSGSMMTSFSGIITMLNPSNPVNWGRFDFSDKSDFTGEATGSGFAAKLGFVYLVNDQLSLGAVYHSKTWLGDLESESAMVSFNVNVDSGIAGGGAANGIFVPATIPLSGKIQIKDFEWPQMIGAGASYQVNDRLMLVFDYKWINWKEVMKNFTMTFTTNPSQPGMASPFSGTELNAIMYQNWKDQHIFMLGAGYKITDDFTVRAGANMANNPIPDFYMNPLFPAIVKNHYMIGMGLMMSGVSSVDAAFIYAPEVKSTNGQGLAVAHSQINAQLMYTYRFLP